MVRIFGTDDFRGDDLTQAVAMALDSIDLASPAPRAEEPGDA